MRRNSQSSHRVNAGLLGVTCTHVADSEICRVRKGLNARVSGTHRRGRKSSGLHHVERWHPLCLAKLLNLKDPELAERVGFEPTCRSRDKTLSRRPRYDHFGTSPCPVSPAWPAGAPAGACGTTDYT